MKLTITINMDGAAFEECGREVESNRILSLMASRIYAGGFDCLTQSGQWAVLDINGNTCGTLVVTEEEGE